MTPQEFAAKIRAKYPGAYDNVSDDALTQKVIAKYPQYKSAVTEAKPYRYEVKEEQKDKIARLQGEAQQAQVESDKQNSLGGKVKNFFSAESMGNLPFIGGAIKVAKTLGKTIDSPANEEQEKYTEQLADRNFNLVRQIRDRKQKGLNTTALEREFNTNADILDDYKGELDKYNKSLPSTGEAVGQLGQMSLDVLTAGTYGKGAQGMNTGSLSKARPSVIPEGGKKIFSKQTLKDVAAATPAGYGYDVALGLQGDRGEENKGGGAFVPGLGTALSVAFPLGIAGVKSGRASYLERQAQKPIKDAERYDKLVGTITQGVKEDIPKAKVALSYIDDPDSIKNYDDLTQKLDDKIETIASKLDDSLDTSTEIRTLDNLSVSQSVGGQTVKHNYVDDALNQLEELYVKSNDPVGAKKIQMLRERAKSQGLTIRELNELAKEHGMEISNKGFNPRTGEPTTNLSAQAFENTRSGLKGTARQIFDNPIYNEADEVLSNLIRTRGLVREVAKNVLKLKQKVSDRGLGEKVGRLVFQVVDKFSGGTVKGFMQSFIPRSGGLKIMNALDLERSLQKNLKILKEVSEGKLPENVLIQKLEELINAGKPQRTLIPERAGAAKPGAINQPGRGIISGQNKLKQP